MALILLAGIVSAGSLTMVVLAYQRGPRNVRCPQCGARTEGVLPHRLIRRAAPRLRIRWCAACSWEGWGRAGPEYVLGRPVAHDSGFQWGAERTPADFGFEWNRPQPGPSPTEPPHHPSGFRFGRNRADPPTRLQKPLDRSFAWGSRHHHSRRRPAFRWRDPS